MWDTFTINAWRIASSTQHWLLNHTAYSTHYQSRTSTLHTAHTILSTSIINTYVPCVMMDDIPHIPGGVAACCARSDWLHVCSACVGVCAVCWWVLSAECFAPSTVMLRCLLMYQCGTLPTAELLRCACLTLSCVYRESNPAPRLRGWRTNHYSTSTWVVFYKLWSLVNELSKGQISITYQVACYVFSWHIHDMGGG